MNPSLHDGAVYKAANFVELGKTKGYARCNGKYTDNPGQPKLLLVHPLRPDARTRLSAPEEQPEWRSPGQAVCGNSDCFVRSGPHCAWHTADPFFTQVRWHTGMRSGTPTPILLSRQPIRHRC